MKKAIAPSGLPAPPAGLFSHGVTCNGFVFVSGMHAGGPHGITGAEHAMPPDAETQADEAFRRIGLVLAAAGCGVENIVSLTIHLASMDDREAVGRSRRRWLGGLAVPPAATLVGGATFVQDGLLVEISAIACCPTAVPAPPEA
ncbi:MAG: RidA family protein [Acetobacter sp.]|uniref:RidA family protein n=1 Tax=Acetobacter sp. TaxID=440 RepID=UPI0039ED7522